MLITLAAFGVARARNASPLAALPFVLMLSFFVFPFISSRGFRALASCDCFEGVEGSTKCFLRDAVQVECAVGGVSADPVAPSAVRAAAWVAVLIYAVCVPAFYASLLYLSASTATNDIPNRSNLRRALRFLTKDYHVRRRRSNALGLDRQSQSQFQSFM